MNSGMPDKPARAPEGLHWSLAVIVVLGVQAIWIVWLDVVPPQAAASPSEPPRIAYMPLATPRMIDADGPADALYIASPTLFALPDEMGFSRRFLSERIGLHPPLDRRVELAMPLHRPELFLWPVGAIELEGLRRKLDLTNRSFPLAPPGGPALAAAPSPGRRLPRIVILDGLSERRFEQTPLDQVQALPLTAPWEAEVQLEVDAEGIVRRVLYERRPSDPNLANTLIRALYAWRMTPAESAATGRVHVSGPGTPNPVPTPAGRAP